jgi:predicted transposase YdaD
MFGVYFDRGHQEGRQEGLQEGMQRGQQEGRAEAQQATERAHVLRLAARGFAGEAIAELLGMPLDKVHQYMREGGEE